MRDKNLQLSLLKKVNNDAAGSRRSDAFTNERGGSWSKHEVDP